MVSTASVSRPVWPRVPSTPSTPLPAAHPSEPPLDTGSSVPTWGVVGGQGGVISPPPSSTPTRLFSSSTPPPGTLIKILTANDMCSLLLGRGEERLCGGSKRLVDFITCPTTARYLASLAPESPTCSEDTAADSQTPHSQMPPEDLGVTDGNGAVVFSGRVVSVEIGENRSQLCSLWLKGLPHEAGQEQRWVAVLEPVEVTQAKATVDYKGAILEHDEAFRTLFNIPEAMLVFYLENIHNVIPSLQLPLPPPISSSSATTMTSLPVEMEQQQCTGVNVDSGGSFPMCVQVFHHHSLTPSTPALDLNILVFSNISGLVVLDNSGTITDYNYSFTHFLFGYGQGELEAKSITYLIPNFYEDMGQGHELDFEDEVSTESYWQDDAEEVEESRQKVHGQDIQKENEKGKGGRLGKSPRPTAEEYIIKPSNNSNTAAPHSQAMRDITNSLNTIDLKSQQPQQCLYNTWVKDKSLEENKTSVVETVTTSTPAGPTRFSPPTPMPTSDPIDQGTFFGTGRHKDGSDLKIICQIRKVVVEVESAENEKKLNTGGGGGESATYYYMWILNDRDGMVDDAPSTLDLTRASLHDTTEPSLGHAITREAQEHQKLQQQQEQELHKQKNNNRKKRREKRKKNEEGDDDGAGNETADSSYCLSFSSSSECDDGDAEHSHTCTDGSSGAEYSLNHSRRGGRHSTSSAPDGEKEEGEFSQHYQVLKQIGKGAFGCVKLSYRYSDGLLVVTKFIKKSKVYQDSWVDDLLLGRRVPLEVSLLMSLNHPNIVTVLDVFENDGYFQLVMEKLGSGMDLFEFIDRNPRLDEFLAAHIFRQIVAALSYLHSLNIVHRDVKDENVIMDNRFHVKLIDFGSSAFTTPGMEFSQFAGTVEYCSPEVLMGNKYTGYEVEVWSLGVTLYTLMYWENPFYDVDETIKGVLNIPYEHSRELTSLLKGMLEKDVSARLTLLQVEQHPWTQLPCNPESYVFHHVVPCSKKERNPKHYLKDYVRNNEDDDTSASFSVSSCSLLEEDLNPHHHHVDPSTPSPASHLAIRRTNSATTPCRPSHPSKNRERLWSATPLSLCPVPAEGNRRSPDNFQQYHSPSVTCSTHSRASTTHSLSSIRSTITVDSASFSACSPHSSTSPSSSSATHSSATSPSTTPTTATASDWANTQLKSTCASSTCQDSSTPLSDCTASSGSAGGHSTPEPCSMSPSPTRTSCHQHHSSSRMVEEGEQGYHHLHGSCCEGGSESPHTPKEASCNSDRNFSCRENASFSRRRRTKQNFLASLFSYSSPSSSSSSSCSSSSSSTSSPEASPHKSPKPLSSSTFDSDPLFYSEPFSFSDLLALTDLDLMEGVLPHPCDPLWDDSTPDSP